MLCLAQLLAFLALVLPLVAAHFNPFGHAQFNPFAQQQQQQQQQQGQGPPASQKGWQHMKELPCDRYTCPASLACVDKPVDCPCPYPEDRKCFIPLAAGAPAADRSFVCTRGDQGCQDVVRLARAV